MSQAIKKILMDLTTNHLELCLDVQGGSRIFGVNLAPLKIILIIFLV